MASFRSKWRLVLLLVLAAMALGAAVLVGWFRPRPRPDAPVVVVQDFERGWLAPGKWPRDGTGSVAYATDWAADGRRSLRIDGGLMAVLSDLYLEDWSRHQTLRMTFLNPAERTTAVGVEIQDRYTTFHERHQQEIAVPPGEHVVEIDLTGGLWRGEENRPYRGAVKTPIELDTISRLSLANRGNSPLYVDRIEIVKVATLETPGGFAFDFGPAHSRVMRHTLAVTETTRYEPGRGYGLLGTARSLERSMSYPTPLLGDGIALDEAGFRIDLRGGRYRGLIAFERGGFWEGEAAGYERAELRVNGETVHSHTFSQHGVHFAFEDLEITDSERLVDDLVWPAHAVASFVFTANAGSNLFHLAVEGTRDSSLRIAGLVLAPDDPEGVAFIQAHEQEQRKTIGATFVVQDRSRREGRLPPESPLIAEPMPVGSQMHPRDWPVNPRGGPFPEMTAARGQIVALQLAVHATRPLTVSARSAPLAGPEGAFALAPRLSHGRYLPQRPFSVGPVWLEVSHYRPEPSFSLGPELARPLLVEVFVPPAAAAGRYEGLLTLEGGGERLELPLRLRVVAVDLQPLPIPVCLLHNALPFSPEALDEERWWSLQERLLEEQARAGFGCVTGGKGLSYAWERRGERYVFEGERALHYLRLAAARNMARMVFPYGGFFSRMRPLEDPQAFARDWLAFEQREALPPHYSYVYDEPGTEEELAAAIAVLEPLTHAGLRTMGYTSQRENDPLWNRLVAATHTIALNEHDAATLARLASDGKGPLVYNNGLGRKEMGVGLWRSIQLGAKARLEWIGMLTQGFAFHNLDGREPFVGAWLVHSRLGIMPTPRWLTAREGASDARIRFALEAAAASAADAVAPWPLDGYRRDRFSDEALDRMRLAMLAAAEPR